MTVKVKHPSFKIISDIGSRNGIGHKHQSTNITDGAKVYARECTTKPNWISAKNTELFVKRRKSTLLICIGESWTYGDNFAPHVQSGKGIDDPFYRLNNNFAGYCAKMLDADLLLSAVPGNCNQNMMHDLDRLLEEYNTKYETIRVIFQLTSPGRDSSETFDWYSNLKGYDFLFTSKTQVDPKVSTKEWFELYDQMMLEEFDRILKSYVNVDGLIWKNFNEFLVDFSSDSFIIVKCPWVRHCAMMHGKQIELPWCNEAGWWVQHYKRFGNFEYNTEIMTQDLDRLNDSTDLLNRSSINGFHPKESYHMLWASHLIFNSTWV